MSRVTNKADAEQRQEYTQNLNRLSFTNLYSRTLFTEFFGMSLRFWWLWVLTAFITMLLVSTTVLQYGLSSILHLDWYRIGITFFAVAAVLFAYPARRILLSIVTLVTGGGSDNATRRQLGARTPTREEREHIIDALQQIKGRGAKRLIREVSDWFVIDSPFPNSYTVGDTGYVTSAAASSQHLTALMAHELGHVQNSDGRKMKALRRLVDPFAFFLGLDRQVEAIGAIVGGQRVLDNMRGSDEKIFFRVQAWKIQLEASIKLGGYGLLVHCMQWADYWRQQDFLADRFVYEWGFAPELIAILEQYQVLDIAQPFLLSGRPYTRERIDRLR